MTEPRHRIVVAMDLGEYSEIVLEHAIDQAARHDAPDLHFVYVVDSPNADFEAIKHQLAAAVLPALEGVQCAAWHVRLHVRTGKVAEEIAYLAGEINAHLIVVGRFATHHPRRQLGSIASAVIAHAPCPTLVVGLSGDFDAPAQCPDCVNVRAETDGEAWFCRQHSGDRMQLSTRVTIGSTWLGGLMW